MRLEDRPEAVSNPTCSSSSSESGVNGVRKSWTFWPSKSGGQSHHLSRSKRTISSGPNRIRKWLGGYSGNYFVVANVPGDHGTRAYYRAVTDADARLDDCPGANPIRHTQSLSLRYRFSPHRKI